MAEPSNLIGPGPSTGFCSLLAQHIVRSEAAAVTGSAAPAAFRLSSRHALRDFLDVRDAVRAYGFILDSGETGRIYRIDSGTERELGRLRRSCWPMPQLRLRWTGARRRSAVGAILPRHLPFRRSLHLNLLIVRYRLKNRGTMLLFPAGCRRLRWTVRWRILSAIQGPVRKEGCYEAQSIRSYSFLQLPLY